MKNKRLESQIIKEKCLGAITSEKPKQDGRNRLKSPVFEIFIIANIGLEILPFFVFALRFLVDFDSPV